MWLGLTQTATSSSARRSTRPLHNTHNNDDNDNNNNNNDNDNNDNDNDNTDNNNNITSNNHINRILRQAV